MRNIFDSGNTPVSAGTILTKEMSLQQVKYEAQQTVSKHALLSCSVRILQGATEDLLLSVEALVYKDQVPDKVGFKLPATWWQAFKKLVFPKWLQRIFPVKYSNHTVAVDVIYPYARLSAYCGWTKTPILRLQDRHIVDWVTIPPVEEPLVPVWVPGEVAVHLSEFAAKNNVPTHVVFSEAMRYHPFLHIDSHNGGR